MYEKYIEDLKQSEDKNVINDKYNIIFKYTLKDAWYETLKSVIVTNEQGDSLYLISKSSEEKKYHVDFEKIIQIIEKHIDKFNNIKDKELPHQPIMDGYIYTIDFKSKDKWYNLEFNNLGYYSKEDIDKNEYLSLIFGLLVDIDDELEDQIKDVENYFVLFDDEEE